MKPQKREDSSDTVKQLSGPGFAGSGIQGGVTRRVSKGDMIVIPARTPHGFSEVQEAVTYLMEIGFNNVQEVEVMPENVRFGLPPEIADAVSNAPREFVRIEGASVS